MKKKIIDLSRSEQGQSLVIIAAVFVGLVALAGLAIDGGYLLVQRRQAQNAADEAFDEAMWEALLSTATVEYPEVAVTQELDDYQRQFEAQLSNQGMELESFFQLTGATPESWREQMRPQAVERLKRRHILTEVVEAEGVEVTDEEVDAEIERVLEPMGERADDMRQILETEPGRLSVRQDLLSSKALGLLKSLLEAKGDEAEAGEAEPSADESKAEAESDEAEAEVAVDVQEAEAVTDELETAADGEAAKETEGDAGEEEAEEGEAAGAEAEAAVEEETEPETQEDAEDA